jgi:hypothetical protein
MADKGTLQIHPSESLTTPDGSQAEIDADMVPLVRALWALNLTTVASCQDFGEGTAGQRRASRRTCRYGGDEFIAYYTSYAWLKMPLPGAQRLANALLSTELRDKITLRWTPGSWRMHVPLIFDENSGIVLDATAQIHFPRDQINGLTAILESIIAQQ